MTYFTKAALVAAIMALGACSNAINGGGLGGDGAGGGTNLNSAAIVPGSVNDPNSPAHFQQIVGDRVLFAVDQSTLSAEAQATLDAQANWLLANTDYAATIEGHADEQGTREYNIALGARRATAVREYLVGRGIAANRLDTVSFGKERPIEVCSDEACYRQNRRSVTVLKAGLTG
jgi:peptidoglycan-associated lipoprotein